MAGVEAWPYVYVLMVTVVQTLAERTCAPSYECPRPSQCHNVALHAPARSSSAFFEGTPDMVVDGHASATWGEDGHCLHFKPEVNPWFLIDLQESYLIHSINISTRGDGYNWEHRDRDLEIRIGDNDKDFESNTLCTKLEGAVGVQAHLCCERPIRGRFVWIQRHSDKKEYMHLCEVEALACNAKCSILGRGHVHTFHNHWLTYPGSCPTVLARDFCKEGVPCDGEEASFVITSHLRHAGNPDDPPVREAAIWFRTMDKLLIELKQGHEVLINGVAVPEFPFQPHADVHITKSPTHVYVTSTSGLEVKWDGSSRLDITLPTHLANHVCGLCGGYRQTEQMLMGPSSECLQDTGAFGTQTEDVGKFGLSWMSMPDKDNAACVEECLDPGLLIQVPCDGDQAARDTCAVISDPEGPFKECILKMEDNEVEQIVDNCVSDLCRLHNLDEKETVCAHAQIMSSRCRDKHRLRTDWRGSFSCHLECPAHLSFQPFAQPCPATCLQLPDSHCPLADPWEEGCVCPPGMVSAEDKCIRPEDCGCTDPELGFIKVNKALIKGECSQRCTCLEESLQVRCEEFSCPDDTVCAWADDRLRTCVASMCQKAPGPETCSDPPEEKWFFVPELGHCDKFTYTGCAGMDNKFNNWNECLWKCLAPRTAGLKRCHLPVDEGPCKGKEERWYYDWGEGTCKTFTYTGCGGNDNNFDSLEVCKDSCYPYIIPDSCYQPPDPGSCDKPRAILAWYYDQLTGVCEAFLRRDCEGEHHGNSYSSLNMCRTTCAPWQHVTPPDICQLRPDRGPCRDESLTRWYFDAVKGRCKKFKYGGCEGNENKFLTEEACKERCDKTEI